VSNGETEIIRRPHALPATVDCQPVLALFLDGSASNHGVGRQIGAQQGAAIEAGKMVVIEECVRRQGVDFAPEPLQGGIVEDAARAGGINCE